MSQEKDAPRGLALAFSSKPMSHISWERSRIISESGEKHTGRITEYEKLRSFALFARVFCRI